MLGHKKAGAYTPAFIMSPFQGSPILPRSILPLEGGVRGGLGWLALLNHHLLAANDVQALHQMVDALASEVVDS